MLPIGGIIDSVGVMAAAPARRRRINVGSQPQTDEFSSLPLKRSLVLAYSYWEARGFSHGMADEDWIRAEAELLARR